MLFINWRWRLSLKRSCTSLSGIWLLKYRAHSESIPNNLRLQWWWMLYLFLEELLVNSSYIDTAFAIGRQIDLIVVESCVNISALFKIISGKLKNLLSCVLKNFNLDWSREWRSDLFCISRSLTWKRRIYNLMFKLKLYGKSILCVRLLIVGKLSLEKPLLDTLNSTRSLWIVHKSTLWILSDS